MFYSTHGAYWSQNAVPSVAIVKYFAFFVLCVLFVRFYQPVDICGPLISMNWPQQGLGTKNVGGFGP